MHRRAFLTGTTGTVIFLAGCNQVGGNNSKTTESPTDTQSSTETATSTASPTQTTTKKPTKSAETAIPELVSNPDGVRTCSNSVSSPDPPDLRHMPVVAGPIGFAPPLGDTEGLLYPYKTLVVVKANTTVTVVVPKAEREHVALSYVPHKKPDKLENAQRSVRFEACPDKITQFPGRIFAEIGCVTFQVWVKIESRPQKATLPISAESCN